MQFLSSRRNKLACEILIVAVVAGAAAWKLWSLVQLLSVVGTHIDLTTSDATLYLAVGRGILNGLIPYRDLFETKPPGIFLLSALSLWLSGGPLLGQLLQVAMFATMPLIFVVLALRETRGLGWFARVTLCLLGLLFGTAMSIFTADRAGGLQTESFGTFFALLFLLTITWNNGRMTRTQTVLAALCLLGAIGMKEPFVASILAAVLLIAEDARFVLRRFVQPLVLAGSMGFVLVTVLGYLHAYLTIYLPEMFGGRLQIMKVISYAGGQTFAVPSPIWERGLNFLKVYEELPWHALVIPGLLLAALLFKGWHGRKRWALIAVLTVCATLYLFSQTDYLFDLASIFHPSLPWNDPLFQAFAFKYAALLALCLAGLLVLFFKSRHLCFATFTTLAAVWLTTTAVLAGALLFWQHFVFGVPLYAATFFVFARAVRDRNQDSRMWPLFASVGVLILLMTLQTAKMPLWKRWQDLPGHEAANERNRIAAQKLDALMDHCGFSRYLPWDVAANQFAFTKHSPLALPYNQQRALDKSPNATLRQQYLESLAHAPIFVTDLDSIDKIDNPEVLHAIQTGYSEVPPACAKPFLPIEGLVVRFQLPGQKTNHR